MTHGRPLFDTMVGMRARLIAIVVSCVAFAALVQACGAENSLVDGECAAGFVACGDFCADLRADFDHCGQCNTRCAPGVACVGGVCGGSQDGSSDGRNDGAGDGSNDGRSDGSSDGSSDGQGDGSSDGQSDGSDACPPPPYVTPAACGACGIVCVAPNSACIIDMMGRPVCAPPCAVGLTECAGRCVDLTNDPLNCGACGKFCPSNICSTSKCQGATPGDVVVIGHDYKDAITGMSQVKVLTNAVFIPTSNPLRVLSYEQFADATNVAHVKALIRAAAVGRMVNFTARSTPASLASPLLSTQFDVVLIHDLQGGAPATLGAIGATWAVDLGSFAQSGGVIVALDGAGGMGGMPELLTGAQLLDIAGHTPLATGSFVSVIAPADRVATLVLSPYGAVARSVTFQPNEPNGGNVVYVAQDLVLGEPVVVHKVVP